MTLTEMSPVEVFIGFVLLLLSLYIVRHTVFALNRLFGRQRYPYVGFGRMALPSVTILVPAHNEEKVIEGSLKALLALDYPKERYRIVPINDRSKDRTQELIDGFVARHPGRISPIHRMSGKPGKAAALKEACANVESDVIIVFDADYLPVPSLLNSLVTPFADPEVGAVMGRVVPMNVSGNFLTRMLDLERSAGYQVDQQARMNLGLVPQYGGTVGGVRREALEEIGGWNDEILAEDTDVTFRLQLAGWSVVYQNGSECYEEVPETWSVRKRQVMRWAKGHNHVFLMRAIALARAPGIPFLKKVDSLLLLGIYFVGPLTFAAWAGAIYLYFMNGSKIALTAMAFFSIVAFSTLGNFALFLEAGAAVHLDGYRRRIRLLPLSFITFLVTLVAITRAILTQLLIDLPFKRKLRWDKTSRYRKPAPLEGRR